jgi:hypothetical protein
MHHIIVVPVRVVPMEIFDLKFVVQKYKFPDLHMYTVYYVEIILYY